MIHLVLLLIGLCHSKTVVVELKDGVTPEEFASDQGVTLQKLDHFKSGRFYAFEVKEHRTRATQEKLSNSEHVEWHEFQEKKRQFTRNIQSRQAPILGRSVASDPLYGSQWHLHGNSVSVDVESAWNEGITGRGVTVGIVDDGVQVSHPDLEVDLSLSHDYNNNRGNNPSPYTTDGHGTSAAGVCCAKRNNGQCGSGVAPDSTLAGVRTIAEAISDLTESSALSYKNDKIDIYSNSWGPVDDGSDLNGPGRLVKSIFKQNTQFGRNGKGSIYVWAGGNGRDNHDSCNYDGYANSIYTIAVGAIDHLGHQSWYSEGCNALFVVAPSSGAQMGITTTDLTGRNGYDRGQCCNSFGGTSSAAPLVAGSIALLLQKRPDLTWRDVQYVLAKSSVHPNQHKSMPNERGYIHSSHFGFGVVNIPRMLSLAEHWKLVSPQKEDTIMCNSNHGCVSNVDLDFVEHITVSINARVHRRGSAEVKLISPNGKESILYEPHLGDSNRNFDFTFMTVHHWGDSVSAGQQWIVSIKNTQGRIDGTAIIHVFGTAL